MASAASAARAVAAPSLDTSEFLETRSVQLEWKVSNLRQLFDQTKGDTKSKCIKSALFDQSRWQIFLYPNSGNDQYLSIYLSCEPTVAEKERALAEQPSLSANDGAHAHPGGKEKERVPWRRDGKYLFTFEVRSVDRRVTFKQLESEKPHTFWYRERNWGYASYLTRNAAFYNNPNTRAADALLIVCTIVSAPTLPSNPPLPHLLVPKTLIHAYASLFDDPDYSDVVFRIRPDRLDGGSGPRRREKRLYAAKKVLAGRSEYFDTMFSSAFSEATLTRPSTSRRDSRPTPTTTSTAPHPLRSSDGLLDAPSESDEDDLDESDDGCDEDDDSGIDESDEDDPSLDDDRAASTHEGSSPAARSLGATVALSDPPRPPPAQLAAASSSAAPAPLVNAHPAASPRRPEAPRRSRTSSMEEPSDDERSPPPPAASGDGTSSAQDPGAARGDGDEDDGEEDDDDEEEDEEPHDRPSTPRGGTSRFVDAPTSAPASPARAMRVEPRKAARQSTRGARGDDRPRFEVVVTDAAYSTFRALLHFLYTDSISFSPLASTYYVAKDHASSSGLPFPYASRRAFLAAQAPSPSPSLAVDGHAGGAGSVKSAQVGPASAKAIYRLADKMGLVELKERAYDHVVSSLTAQNIVYEVFGSFSSRFDEIRRVEVNFLLEKWNEVRAGPQMRKVFEYLRSPSRFPGFEDVWLDLVQNLEVRVPPPAALSPAGAGADTASHGACGSGRGGEGGEQSQGEGGRS